MWQALLKIPAGARPSYSEIARRIGAPKAVRAVAEACAKNRLAVAIPCHRVVRNNGALSGYAWGVARKCVLLDSEASQARDIIPVRAQAEITSCGFYVPRSALKANSVRSIRPSYGLGGLMTNEHRREEPLVQRVAPSLRRHLRARRRDR